MIIDNIKEIKDNRVAYVINDKSITYSELYKNAQELSKRLSNDSSPVIIYSDKCIEYLVLIVACIMAKRAYVPIGTCTPLNRLKKIIDITNSSLLVTDSDIKIDNIKVNSFKDLDSLDIKTDNHYDNNIAYIIFTSGSTGEPKGVPISYSNLNNFIKWISNLYPLNSYKKINVFNQASFSFDLSVADIFYSLCNGHTLYSYNEDFYSFYDMFSNIDVAVMTPTFMKMCLIDESFNEKNYPLFKCVYFCGELLETKLVKKIYDRFPNLKIINAYGPTEATSAVCGVLIDKKMIDKELLPVGSVTDSATNIVIENDEIVLKGPSVFSGYLGNVTGGYYLENNINCYKTGDIGFIKDDLLYIKGRKDDQIKYKGYRIELNDIEYNINKIDGVKDCAVIAKFDDNKIVKTIKAFVVTDNTKEYIFSKLSELVPNYMLPKTVVIVDKLPVNSNGKIDRKALSDL